MSEFVRVFIGYDQREHEAYKVCEASILAHASVPVLIEPIKQDVLRRIGFYRRGETQVGLQKYDLIDQKPFSTEFSFSRFLVPILTMRRGLAVFVDCDFMFRADIAEMMASIDPKLPLSCVHHDYVVANQVKMDGCEQTRYHRKNWSSLMVFNCEHAAHDLLTIDAVNTMPGSWLHGLRWIGDEYKIGSIDPAWNWLEGVNNNWSDPVKAVHWTNGGPWFPGYENVAYAGEYRDYVKQMRAAQ